MKLSGTARLVNGSLLPLGDVDEATSRRLQGDGMAGIRLVYALFTDDIRPPPREVVLEGKDPIGQQVRIVIACK